MLTQLFVRVHFRYTRSSYAADLTAFADWLLANGYGVRYAQRLVFRVMRALESSERPVGSSWTPEQLDRAFQHDRQPRPYRHALTRFSQFLQAAGRLNDAEPRIPHTALITSYRRYLTELRGLAPATVQQHLWEVTAFLDETVPAGGDIANLTAHHVEQYVDRRARSVTRRSADITVETLRGFLRYCYQHGLVAAPLERIDKPTCLRYEMPPRALDWTDIQRLLASIDRTSRTGWRDFMLLYLMAHYGLRPGEIQRLTLESIDWSAKTLVVEQSKTHSYLTLPLMAETLHLLQRYLQKGRRESPRRELFLNALAPDRGLTNCNISMIFKACARKSGLPIPRASAYALRHSFAMRLFGQGVGIKAIGDLMGHNSLVSTAVYLRLQTDALREVALPVPNGATVQGGGA